MKAVQPWRSLFDPLQKIKTGGISSGGSPFNLREENGR